MSIASEITALISDRTNIAAAIVAKGVSSAANHGFDKFASDIATIPTGTINPDTLQDYREGWF